MLKSEIEQVKEEILNVSGVNPKKCMICGKCSGTCPNYDAMEYHPHQFVQMVENGEIEKLLSTKSIYAQAVRDVVERKRGPQHLQAEAVPSYLDGEIPQQAIVSAFRKYKK